MVVVYRFLLWMLAAGLLLACSKNDAIKMTPEALLAELQSAVRSPGSKCRLEGREPGTDKRVERLLRATAADIVFAKRPAYEVAPAFELVIRGPEPKAPLLSALVFLRDGYCDRFDLADVWEERPQRTTEGL